MPTPTERTGPGAAGPHPAHRGTTPDERVFQRLAAYVAWLAVQLDHEATRRRYREVAEHYLRWCERDRGPAVNRRARYCADGAAGPAIPDSLVCEALDRLAEHDRIRAVTLPHDR